MAGPAEPGWEHALGWFAADPEANATTRCLGADFEHADGTPAVASVPFSSARMWSSVTSSGEGPRTGSWIPGAPEVVLGARPGSAGTVPTAGGVLDRAGQLAASVQRTVHPAQANGTTITVNDPTLPADVNPVVVHTFREQIRPMPGRHWATSAMRELS